MKQVSYGSVMLIALVILTVTALWLTNLWRTISYMNDLMYARQEYEQQFRLTESLLEYGMSAAKILSKRWHNKDSASTRCIFDQWPEKGDYAGIIVLSKSNQIVKVNAQLLKKDNVIFRLASVLHEVEDENKQDEKKGVAVEKKYRVASWSFNDTVI